MSARQSLVCLLAVLSLCMPPRIYAGGYIGVTASGDPMKWFNTNVVLRYDQGPLGSLTNAQADTMVTDGMAVWTNVVDSTIALSQDTVNPELSEDHDGIGADPNFYESSPDGVNPVIYDTDGTLIENQLGAGQSAYVIGFAGPYWIDNDSGEIVEGHVVLNGLFIDGDPDDLSLAEMQGVVTHEAGHMLGLDHAQFGEASKYDSGTNTPDFTGYPTMHPISHSDIGTLALDDITWISCLYPAGTFPAGYIEGTVSDQSSALLNGVNVVARNASDPKQIISCVSGYKDGSPSTTPDGTFRIPGLATGGRWVLDFEQIWARYNGGSSVGPVDPPLIVPGAPEFVNESGQESASDDVKRTTTFVVTGGVTGANLQLNGNQTTTTIAESDPGPNFPNGMVLTPTPGTYLVINGSISTSEGGNLAHPQVGDPIEDWYVVAPPAGLEIRSIVLLPTSDCDLYVCSYDQAGSSVMFSELGLNVGTGVPERIEGFMETLSFGTGTQVGKVFIGVSNYNGEPNGTYQLIIETAVSDNDALVVSGTSSDAVDPTTGLISVTGRGFKNTGGAPTVSFEAPGIQVNSVTYVSPTQLNVNVTRLPSFNYQTQTTSRVYVQNAAGSGGFSGSSYPVATAPVTLSAFEAE